MLNITIDTCVWLKLLSIDFKNEDNYFEEICFWIENNHIKHIVPTNIIDEWNRHKIAYQNDIVVYFKKLELESINPYKHNAEIASTYNSAAIESNVQKRIERIDVIFSIHSEKAPYDDNILIEAGKRNLNKSAPNHSKDSFRDTVNVISLIHYIKSKGYDNSIFTSINYKDFSVDSNKKYELHSHLKNDFASVNLDYIFFDEKENFGNLLFNQLRNKYGLISFQTYLKDKKDKEEAQKLLAQKSIDTTQIATPDADYLENIKHIDMVLSKKVPTSFELEMIKSLIGRHTSYKQYFLNNLGNNGMV